MADKSVGELISAQSVTPTDLFVLEQNGTAKKLTGQILENWLVSFANGHGGIHSIVKHSTSGLKDTYRITLADTTTFDFIVTNGKAISSVKQTSVSGLTRTYTIAFNDGTSKTFTVTDGRSITDIVNTGTNVLTDTYTISYNDGSTSTFNVKNGKGISSFAKVSTVGLVDTYRIEYNDNTSDEFTVTNGAKGEKGDNQYVWIKYASQKPTESNHSFGDVADNWIGIYSGESVTAPTDWKEYTWFEIKGEKGDTGDPAILTNTSVEYQASDSGVIIPSGSWQTSVPVVAQGRYLWTRTTNTFNTGSPVVSYSVTRMGLDGSGSVSSVANIGPDGNGNVPLTAAAVGALPSAGGYMTGPINMNGKALTGLNAPEKDSDAVNRKYAHDTFALAGFGLGGRATFVSNPDNAINSGFYRCEVIPEVASNGDMAGLVVKNSDTWVVQIWWYAGIFFKREMQDGIWQPYEFFNARMELGVKYRTVERWNGKPVYTWLIDCGTSADGKIVSFGETLNVIRYSGRMGGVAIPGMYGSPSSPFSYGHFIIEREQITMFCNHSSFVGKQTYCQIWYTLN